MIRRFLRWFRGQSDSERKVVKEKAAGRLDHISITGNGGVKINKGVFIDSIKDQVADIQSALGPGPDKTRETSPDETHQKPKSKPSEK